MRGDGAAMLPQGAAAPQAPHAPAALHRPQAAAIPQAPVGPQDLMPNLRHMLQDGTGLANFHTVQAMATE